MRAARLAIIFCAGFLTAESEPGITPPVDVVNQYVLAVQAQQARSADAAMQVEIDARIPRLKKTGRLQALRFISRLGQITYRVLRFEGDGTVKKDVIARYLAAEQEARTQYSAALAVTPENYRFKYKGTADYAGRTAYVFQVTPKQKRVGLFKGEIWIDAQTYLPLREWGEMVKNPSVFLKNVYFVRDYYIQNGMAVPRRVLSDVSTRLVGKVQLTIWYDHFTEGEQARTLVSALVGGSIPADGPAYRSQ